MTDEDEFVDGTWAPDGGENAVIVQPGSPSDAETQQVAIGPTLFQMVQRPGQPLLVPVACEFSAELTLAADPDLVDVEAVD